MKTLPISVPQEALAGFCRRHGIARLSFFGSVIRDDFSPDSDVDVLVEFEPGRTPGLFGFARLEEELTRLIGRRVDLNTEGTLSEYFSEEVLREAVAVYVAA